MSHKTIILLIFSYNLQFPQKYIAIFPVQLKKNPYIASNILYETDIIPRINNDAGNRYLVR